MIYFAVGIAIGVTVFPLKWLKVNSWLQTIGISLTLFSMGASMAGSPTFLEDLREAGLQGFLYAVVTIAGSVLLVWLLSRIVMKKAGEDE
ncbi:LysO family transporter [Oscillospiraceae bacterium PP1C4]